MIQIAGLSKRFGSRTVFEGLFLEVDKGERVAVLGPSGTGKTTLLRLIAGLDEPDAGTIRLEGVDVTGVPPHRRNIAWLPQGPSLWPTMTARGNARFVAGTGRQGSVNASLQALRIGEVADRMPHTLSGGQAQRAAIARTLAAERPIVLLDEPFAHLGDELALVCARHILGSLSDSRATLVAVGHDRVVAELLDARPVELSHLSGSRCSHAPP